MESILSRDDYFNLAKKLFIGLFRNVNSYSKFITIKRNEYKISYPHNTFNVKLRKREKKCYNFELLARSFLLASFLIKEKKDIEINGIDLKKYYKNFILRLCTPNDKLYVGDYKVLSNYYKDNGVYQHTVECASLTLGLWITKEYIWDTYTLDEKNIIADFLSSFGHSFTVNQNWRVFNMLILAFLHSEGYKIDENIMKNHLDNVISNYSGSGFYLDGSNYDYYSALSFNFYLPIWNILYGYVNEPEAAKTIEDISNDFVTNFINFFDEDGFMTLWGRSNIYRSGVLGCFSSNLLLKNSKCDIDKLKIIYPKNICQFMNNDKALEDGILTLGFYKEFSGLFQSYSSNISPYWFANLFLILCLDKQHLFWKKKNNVKSKKNIIESFSFDSPGIHLSKDFYNGEVTIKTGKILKDYTKKKELFCYGKLAYNSKFVWSGIEYSMQYVIKDLETNNYYLPNLIYWIGEKKGVLYRKEYFNFTPSNEKEWLHSISLAEFNVPYGWVRVDKLNIYKSPVSIEFGSYGIDSKNIEISYLKKGSYRAILIRSDNKSMAMTMYKGFEDIVVEKHKNINPEHEEIALIKVFGKRIIDYENPEKNYLITQVLTKNDNTGFTEEEIFLVNSISFTGISKVNIKTTTTHTVDFNRINGGMML